MILLFSLFVAAAYSRALHPTFFMHGINGHGSDFDRVISKINHQYPGTWTHSFSGFSGAVESWVPLQDQIVAIKAVIREKVLTNLKTFMHGYNLVCHSQGALLCRCLIEDFDDHHVRTFISLAGPQEGVYGYAYLDSVGWFKNHPAMTFITMQESHKVLYSKEGQLLSVGNMWHDPYHEEEYREKNHFLPRYNGVSTGNNTDIARFKKNFLRVKNAHFFVGSFSSTEFDDGIEPWQSGAFGYYNARNNRTYYSLKESDLYINDRFGLKTMDEEGRLDVKIVPGIHHSAWEWDSHTIDSYIFPVLD